MTISDLSQIVRYGKKLKIILRKDTIKKFLVHPVSVKYISSLKNSYAGWVLWYVSSFEDLSEENRKEREKKHLSHFHLKQTFLSLCWNDSDLITYTDWVICFLSRIIFITINKSILFFPIEIQHHLLMPNYHHTKIRHL